MTEKDSARFLVAATSLHPSAQRGDAEALRRALDGYRKIKKRQRELFRKQLAASAAREKPSPEEEHAATGARHRSRKKPPGDA